ncbi:putative sugar phosphate/phosphate translocator [Diplonema papillatum]|nr:putative sugar phosphate/phosphate translocator [Diplonema papillatum]|eukprot:gene21877-33613_t
MRSAPSSPRSLGSDLQTSLAYKVCLCAAYLSAGPSLIILNKTIMQEQGFAYPITLSALGMVASSIFAWSFAEIRPHCREIMHLRPWFRQCVPVGLCKAATLTLGNAAYLHLNLGFIQMLKCFSPVIVLGIGAALQVERPKGGVVVSVLLICVGTAVTTGFDPSASRIGLLLFVGAAVTEAVNLVLTQHLLQDKKFSVMEAQYALAPPGVLFLALAAVFLEWPTLVQERHYLLVFQNPLSFTAAATLGLAINFLTFYVIQVTSSLTLKILGMLRNIGLVFVGVLSYKERVPLSEATGFVVSLLGLVLYNYFKANPAANDMAHVRLKQLVCPREKQPALDV